MGSCCQLKLTSMSTHISMMSTLLYTASAILTACSREDRLPNEKSQGKPACASYRHMSFRIIDTLTTQLWHSAAATSHLSTAAAPLPDSTHPSGQTGCTNTKSRQPDKLIAPPWQIWALYLHQAIRQCIEQDLAAPGCGRLASHSSSHALAVCTNTYCSNER